MKNLILAASLLTVGTNALAAGFPVPELPDVSIRGISLDVKWNERHTATYKFTTIGFNKERHEKIKTALQMMYNVLKNPQNLSNVGPTTNFQQCIMDKATKHQNPNWMDPNMDERRYAVAIISGMMVVSAGKLNMIHAFTETKASDGRDFIRGGFAKVGKVEGGMNTVININTYTVDKRTERSLAGLIFHEMMHNIGWSHPTTGESKKDYPGTFIKEAQNCLVEQLPDLSTIKFRTNDGLIFEG